MCARGRWYGEAARAANAIITGKVLIWDAALRVLRGSGGLPESFLNLKGLLQAGVDQK